MPLTRAAISLLCSVSNLLGAINRGSRPTSSIAFRVIRSNEAPKRILWPPRSSSSLRLPSHGVR